MKDLYRKAASTLFALWIVTCTAPAFASDQESERQRILEADAKWSADLKAKKLDAVMENYAEDAAFLAPHQPIIQGKPAIRAWFQQRIDTPGYSASFAPTHIVVSASLDMAYELGAYEASWKATDGQTMGGVGKHLVTWEKRDGVWKVTAESISADAPPKPVK